MSELQAPHTIESTQLSHCVPCFKEELIGETGAPGGNKSPIGEMFLLRCSLCGPELRVIPKQSALIQAARGLEHSAARGADTQSYLPHVHCQNTPRYAIGRLSPNQVPRIRQADVGAPRGGPALLLLSRAHAPQSGHLAVFI
uniref:Uncharacterized protein n=1 Tax=Knipowitschia caucasica TaxID=637954 RepID=A0AAV2J449_KNICA